VDFCLEAFTEALGRHGTREIFNIDQGSQFTAEDFTQALEDKGIRVSTDGKKRRIDNVFVERLWRSVKYEEVYLRAYETPGKPIEGSKNTSSSTTRAARIRASSTKRRTRHISKSAISGRRRNMKPTIEVQHLTPALFLSQPVEPLLDTPCQSRSRA
jgi:transposase InsO family protein